MWHFGNMSTSNLTKKWYVKVKWNYRIQKWNFLAFVIPYLHRHPLKEKNLEKAH